MYVLLWECLRVWDFTSFQSSFLLLFPLENVQWQKRVYTYLYLQQTHTHTLYTLIWVLSKKKISTYKKQQQHEKKVSGRRKETKWEMFVLRVNMTQWMYHLTSLKLRALKSKCCLPAAPDFFVPLLLPLITSSFTIFFLLSSKCCRTKVLFVMYRTKNFFIIIIWTIFSLIFLLRCYVKWQETEIFLSKWKRDTSGCEH